MLHIRDAVLQDLPAILDIYNEAIRTTTATFDLEEETLEQRKIWFQKYGEKYPLIVGVLNEEVVGYCCLSSFRSKPAYTYTTELSVYISRLYHGAGIGSRLMESILSRASEKGFHTIVSGVTSGNEASVKLHKKFGFQHIGHFKEVGYKFDKWQDVDFYQLIIPTDL